MFASVPQGDAMILKVSTPILINYFSLDRFIIIISDILIKVLSTIFCHIIVGCVSQLVRWEMHRIFKQLSQSSLTKWEGDCCGVHIARGTNRNWRI
jgi:hypothetical protein